ncbi:MAG: hypothetical protein EBS85_04825 [Micrococcales bacterium]|jgi:hypothetical protein|nr:hypothetical protein [Micrococcales bacterium]
MKKSIFATVLATVLAVTLAACSASGAKQIVLRAATGETDTFTLGQRANVVGELDVSDSTLSEFDVVIEELAPGGSWVQFRKLVAHKESTSIGFALIKNLAGDYQYRAIISGKEYGPFTSAPLTIHYETKSK